MYFFRFCETFAFAPALGYCSALSFHFYCGFSCISKPVFNLKILFKDLIDTSHNKINDR